MTEARKGPESEKWGACKEEGVREGDAMDLCRGIWEIVEHGALMDKGRTKWATGVVSYSLWRN